ncbi:18660_t:CDS:1 [Acaulospora morrowiae]|uniref:18660_t:CDS:1 n=1 Tax=Acaulospora morrowiae TaxID=94023 RepID=A0A9N9CVK9_9GLOM|nr:18660_t:CDS:1 [Acaulospora morrowiae]
MIKETNHYQSITLFFTYNEEKVSFIFPENKNIQKTSETNGFIFFRIHLQKFLQGLSDKKLVPRPVNPKVSSLAGELWRNNKDSLEKIISNLYPTESSTNNLEQKWLSMPRYHEFDGQTLSAPQHEYDLPLNYPTLGDQFLPPGYLPNAQPPCIPECTPHPGIDTLRIPEEPMEYTPHPDIGFSHPPFMPHENTISPSEFISLPTTDNYNQYLPEIPLPDVNTWNLFPDLSEEQVLLNEGHILPSDVDYYPNSEILSEHNYEGFFPLEVDGYTYENDFYHLL